MNVAACDGDLAGDDATAGADVSRDDHAPQSSQQQVMPPLAALQPEVAALVRAPAVGALEGESAAAPPWCMRLLFAFGMGVTIALSSFVVLVAWYRLFPEPEKILLSAVPPAQGVARAVGATVNVGTPTALAIIQYVGVPQTILPDNWNGSDDAAFEPTTSSLYDGPTGSLVGLAAQENGTDSSMLPAPL